MKELEIKAVPKGLPSFKDRAEKCIKEPASPINLKYGSPELLTAGALARLMGGRNFSQYSSQMRQSPELYRKVLDSEGTPDRSVVSDRLAALDPEVVQSFASSFWRELDGFMESLGPNGESLSKKRARKGKGKGKRGGKGSKKSLKRMRERKKEKKRRAKDGAEEMDASSVPFSERGKYALDGKIQRGEGQPAKGVDDPDVLGVMNIDTKMWVAMRFIPNKGHEKSNAVKVLESAGLPEGSVITFDAGITTKRNLRWIKENGYEYICAMKTNNGRVHSESLALFKEIDESRELQRSFDEEGAGVKVVSPLTETQAYSEWSEEEVSNGRREIRRYDIYMSPGFLPRSVRDQYPGLKGVGRARRTVWRMDRTEEGFEFWRRSDEEVLYLISVECSCEEFGGVARLEWTVENGGHHVLDVTFLEDFCKVKRWGGQVAAAFISRTAQNYLTLLRRLMGDDSIPFPELIIWLQAHPLVAVQLLLGFFRKAKEARPWLGADSRDYLGRTQKSLPGLSKKERRKALKRMIKELKRELRLLS